MSENHEERREGCASCFKDQFNKMVGAQSVNKWLLRIVVVIIVFNGGWSGIVGADQSTRIALLENAVVELKDMAKQNQIEHDQLRKEREQQTAVIVEAVTKAIEDVAK